MPGRKDNTGLTTKEKMFCAEYLTDFDAKNAAIRAGYKPRYAATQGCRMLQRPEIGSYIKQLTDARLLKLELTADAVLEELRQIAFARIEDFMQLTTTETGVEPAVKGKYPAAVSQRVVHINPDTGAKVVTHFSLKSKIDALCALGRNFGIFGRDGHPSKPAKPIVITPRGKRMLQLLENHAQLSANNETKAS